MSAKALPANGPFTIGELFSGYGGLGLGVTAAIPNTAVAWHSDNDADCSAILNHHWPDIPNHGDIRAIEWDTVEPVHILTGGSPCQDISNAGKRGGLTGRNRSNLWVSMREAIAALRPPYVVWENVRGAFSANADSLLEPCTGCMGDGPIVPLRALSRVLGDFTDLGYDTQWCGLRAADVGAPHGRFRVFIVARNNRELGDIGPYGDTNRATSGQRGESTRSAPAGGGTRPNSGRPNREPVTYPSRQRYGRKQNHRRVGHMDRENERQTPQQRTRAESRNRTVTDWGKYTHAIRRWESLTRPAPPPNLAGGRRNHSRLNPAFVEWLMGLPEGHVTDPAIGLSRNAQLKALGNGVVPQQAAAAVAYLMSIAEVTV
jgi:DNA (cytosine-5)-methyltransferase 1